MSRTPLSNVDTAWLRMEEPDDLMMICGVLVFGAPLESERLKATLENGLLRYSRFRQRAVLPRSGLGRPYWEADPDFDMSYHLRRIQLAPPADQTVLQDVASELASTQLDLRKPLWQFHLVEDYGQGSALICRLHHCIADGVALVHVLLSLTSPDADSPPWIEYMEMPSRPEPQPAARLFPRTRRLLGASRKVTQAIVSEGRKALADPDHAAALLRTGLEGTRALAVLVGRWPDPKTVFKGPLGLPKRVAWSAPTPLAEVKGIGRRLGGTVNDVLLSAVAGGLRRYLLAHGQRVEGLNFRGIIPVNMRKPGTEAELGNKFSLFFLSLPVGIGDPAERLRELKRRMDGLKGSLEAPVAFGILNAIGMAPEPIQDVVVNIFGTKGTAVMTNVVGPRVKIYLAGAPLEGMMFWVPQSGRLGMGVSIMSYADQVWLGVITDRGLVPDPELIVEGYQAELEALLNLARQPEAQPSLARMVGVLDRALETLDEIAPRATAAQPAPAHQPVAGTAARCQAVTREGRPCRNAALPSSSFCRVHQGHPTK